MASPVVLPTILVCGLRKRRLWKDEKTKTFLNKGSYSGSNATSTCVTLSVYWMKTRWIFTTVLWGGYMIHRYHLQVRKLRLQGQGSEQLQATQQSFEGVRIWTQVFWFLMWSPWENCGASCYLERLLGLTHLAVLGQKPDSLSKIDINSVIHPWNVF